MLIPELRQSGRHNRKRIDRIRKLTLGSISTLMQPQELEHRETLYLEGEVIEMKQAASERKTKNLKVWRETKTIIQFYL